jgi:outer membrane protein assembly factor BamB
VWAKQVYDNSVRYYMTLAPLAADGKILVGASGGEFGVRGYVAALDPETGNELWRTYTIPAPGEPGSETWPKGDQWKNGGGSSWVTGNYDPESNTAYWGTGNGGRGWAISGPVTTCIRRRRLRSTHRPASSSAISSTTRTNRSTGTRCRRRS